MVKETIDGGNGLDGKARGKGGSTASASSADSSEGNAGQGGRDGGDGGRNTSAEKTPLVGVAVLEDKKPLTREERNARRREKYAEEKAKNGKAVKVRKAKKQGDCISADDIKALLIALSSIIASRENMSHWLLSEGEAKAVAEPLAKVLEKSEALKAISTHSDSVALVIACVTVFVPRVVMSIPIIKKTGGKNGGKIDRFTESKDEGIVAKSDSDTTADGNTNCEWLRQYSIKAD